MPPRYRACPLPEYPTIEQPPAQHTHQRTVAYLLPLAGWTRIRLSKSSTTTDKRAFKWLPPIPPSEILYEDFMKPLGVSINALAREIALPPNRVSDIVIGKRSITADTALRLGKFSASPRKSGWGCRWTTICASRSARPASKLSRACGCNRNRNQRGCVYRRVYQRRLPYRYERISQFDTRK